MIEEIRENIDATATGRRIRELRDLNGLRITDISDALGFYEPQAVYKWMRGECLPTLRNMYRLSILFNTTIDDIVRGAEAGEE
jgi:transcriptional regulator with XRE-family HTH domain